MSENFKISYYLPETIVSNNDLGAFYSDWDSARVFDQTGIERRHYAFESETASDLAVKACEKLFSEYGIDRNTVDFLILVTECSDYKLPATACIVQDRLGLKKSCGAFDINMGCSGFTYALSVAKGFLVSNSALKILVVTSECLSKYIHNEDKGLRTIVGDAAAACLVDKASAAKIGNFVFGTDGGGYKDIIIEAGGERLPVSDATKEKIKNPYGEGFITRENLIMNGINVFTFAITSMPGVINDILLKNDTTMDSVDFYVFHQANKTILEYLRRKTKAPAEKFYINMRETGNTSSCTIPLALKMAEDEGALKAGMKTMILGFGVGLSWCGTIIEW